MAGSGHGHGGHPAPAVPAKPSVSIESDGFSPASVKCKVGVSVCWTNDDGVNHTVTFDDTALGTSGIIVPGATFDKVFPAAGTFPYKCDKHPEMKGTVVVS